MASSLKPHNDSQDATAAQNRNSAVRGAVSAVTNLDQSKGGVRTTTKTSDGASQAAFKAGQVPVVQHEQIVTKPDSLKASTTAFTSPSLLLPAPTTNESLARAVSPSNIAAQIASSRYSPATPKPAQNHRGLARSITTPYNIRPQSPPLEEEERLPAVGTVNEVQKWLKSLDAQARGPSSNNRGRNNSSAQRIEERPVPQKVKTLPVIDTNVRSVHTNNLNGESSKVTTRNAEDQIQEIQSPKPVRVSSGVFLPQVLHKSMPLDEVDIAQKPPVDSTNEPHKLGATGDKSGNLARASASRSGSASSEGSRRESFSTAIESLGSPRSPTVRRTFSSRKKTEELNSDIKPKPPLPRKSSRAVAPTRSLSRVTSKNESVPSTLGATPPITRSRTPSLNETSVPKLRPNLEQTVVTRKNSQVMAKKDDSANQVNNIANAIVAGHLASGRSSSPFKLSSPTPTRRHTEAVHVPFLHSKHEQKKTASSRTPSPSKGMRYTMRQDPSSDSSSDEQTPRKHKKILGIRKHPHKHHEGTRKRWRDSITERERKRYEGVWAANRGLYVVLTRYEQKFNPGMEPDVMAVSNVVVKDIWSRSRLPETTLGEIWDLVDRQGIGRLDREEFVVGLWLVDQMLKGRKLPTRVGESVWQSVRGVQGVKVPPHHKA